MRELVGPWSDQYGMVCDDPVEAPSSELLGPWAADISNPVGGWGDQYCDICGDHVDAETGDPDGPWGDQTSAVTDDLRYIFIYVIYILTI